MMTKPKSKFRAARVVAATLTAGGLLALARCVPEPVTPEIRSPEEATAESRLGKEPTMTPYEVQPELLNRTEFTQALSSAYPSLLRDAGIGGTVDLWVFVNSTGRVSNTRVEESSGRPELDAAAVEVVRGSSWKSARDRGEVVPAWVRIPVVFRSEKDASQRGGDEGSPDPKIRGVVTADSRLEPKFTPFDRQPELMNREAIGPILQQVYPEMLRDAGIGGTTTLWVRIDEEGAVRDTRIHTSSGHDALDQAAAAAMRQIHFHPARLKEQAVAVWVKLPITFAAKAK